MFFCISIALARNDIFTVQTVNLAYFDVVFCVMVENFLKKCKYFQILNIKTKFSIIYCSLWAIILVG